MHNSVMNNASKVRRRIDIETLHAPSKVFHFKISLFYHLHAALYLFSEKLIEVFLVMHLLLDIFFQIRILIDISKLIKIS